MVLIIPKKIGKNITLVFLPKKPLFDMLERHIHRIGLASRDNTCFVLQDGISIPKDKDVVSLIIKLLLEVLVKEAMDNKYPITKHLKKSNIMLRNFANNNTPVNNASDKGYMKISAVKIKGRATLAIKMLRNYENIGEKEMLKIRNTFDSLNKEIEKRKAAKIIIYLIHHLHPTT